MTLIADILMIAGALGAAFYCMVLSRRLRRFADLEKGVGGAVAILSVQVDDMNKTIRLAERAAAESAARLNELTARSEDAARRLELMFAAMHDLPTDDGGEHAMAADGSATQDPPAAPHTPVEGGGENDTQGKVSSDAPSKTIFSSRRKLGEKAA